LKNFRVTHKQLSFREAQKNASIEYKSTCMRTSVIKKIKTLNESQLQKVCEILKVPTLNPNPGISKPKPDPVPYPATNPGTRRTVVKENCPAFKFWLDYVYDDDLKATTDMESKVKNKNGLPAHEKKILKAAIEKYLGTNSEKERKQNKTKLLKKLHPDKNLACINLATYTTAVLNDSDKPEKPEKPEKQKLLK